MPWFCLRCRSCFSQCFASTVVWCLVFAVVCCCVVLAAIPSFSGALCGLRWLYLCSSFFLFFELLSRLLFAVVLISDPKSNKNGTKIVAKPHQNRCWRGSGGHLGALLDKRLSQNIILDDFGTLLGPLWRPTGAQQGPRERQDGAKMANLEPRRSQDGLQIPVAKDAPI